VKLIAGLGNPGAPYRGTRHNVGFDVLEVLAGRHGLSFRVSGDLAGAEWRREDEKVLLLKPLTFMNLSGQVVASVRGFYKIDVADLLVVCDDVNLPLGRLRARASGSEGGHNGLRSVAEHLGTAEYARLRVGVGRGDNRRELADHVLGKFAPDERPEIEDAVSRAADAVEMFVDQGLANVMASFNGERST
jgi:peptidyl-tRNA hydrolase, PTH1 family